MLGPEGAAQLTLYQKGLWSLAYSRHSISALVASIPSAVFQLCPKATLQLDQMVQTRTSLPCPRGALLVQDAQVTACRDCCEDEGAGPQTPHHSPRGAASTAATVPSSRLSCGVLGPACTPALPCAGLGPVCLEGALGGSSLPVTSREISRIKLARFNNNKITRNTQQTEI